MMSEGVVKYFLSSSTSESLAWKFANGFINILHLLPGVPYISLNSKRFKSKFTDEDEILLHRDINYNLISKTMQNNVYTCHWQVSKFNQKKYFECQEFPLYLLKKI